MVVESFLPNIELFEIEVRNVSVCGKGRVRTNTTNTNQDACASCMHLGLNGNHSLVF